MNQNLSKEVTPDKTIFLTQSELAKVIGVHEVTVSKWTNEKVIPCIRIGKKSVRYDLAKVREFLSATPEPKAPERTAPESNASKTKASKVGKRNAKSNAKK